MKKDIMVIRESIGRIVSMLTMQKIRVTQRGSRAYVKYHPKSGEIEELNVPYIPDDASDEFVAAIQGFLDHEVGHVLHSDFAALKAATKEGARVANLANLVEDVFVERKMTETFRGSGMNLESVRKFYLEKICRPKIDAALRAGNMEEASGYAVVAAFRAWGGQTSAQDFIKEPKIAALVQPVADKVGPELMDALLHTKNSMECLELARKFKAKLERPKPPPPPPEPAVPDPSLAPAVSGEPESKEDEDEDEGGEEEIDEGTTHAESDDSGKKRDPEEELDAIDDPTDAGEEGGDATGEKVDSDESEDDADSEDPLADSGEPESGDESGEDSDADSGEGEDLGDTPAEASPSSGGDTEEEEAPDASADAGGDDGDEGEIDMAEPGSAPMDAEPDPIADMFDTKRDFDEDMSERLSKDAKSEIASADYKVFSTEFDKIEPAPLAGGKSAVDALDDKIRDKIGVMQKSLERAMAAKARKTWNPGQRRGRIAPGNLFRTCTGDDRVFRSRFETQARNTAVSLVVDCSGSMGGSKIHLAGVAAYALSTVLDRLKITHEVIGFTAFDSGEMRALIKSDAKYHGVDAYRAGWSRIEPVYMPVFKPFSSKLDTQARSRIAHLTERPDWLHQNIDGESVQIAARRLLQQRAERHVMIVLSDGEPRCTAGRGQEEHLKKVVKEMTAQGVEVIGIGIQSTAVKRFYPKHVVLNDADELPARVMSELTKLLLAA